MNNDQGGLSRRQLMLGGASVLGIAGLASLVGCGGDDDTAGQTTPGSAGATSAGAKQRGGTLLFGFNQGTTTDSLDLQHGVADFEIGAGLQLHSQLSVVRDGELKYQLAEEYEVVSPTEIAIRLKQGLEFHNGRTITANDVLASFARILDPTDPGSAAGSFRDLDLANSKVVDDRTLTLMLTSPNVFFSQGLSVTTAVIYPDGEWDEANPIGAGPWKVTKFTPGTSVEYVPFENYWGDGPHTDRLIFQNFADPTALVNAISSGAINLAGEIPAAQARTLGGGIQVIDGPTGGFAPYVMNTTVAPFNDVRVRQAFRLLTDRQGLIDQLQNGKGAIGNDLYSPTDPAHIGDSLAQREQDIDQAKSLLKAAVADGLNLTLAVSGFVANGEVVFAEQARAAGVNIEVQQMDQTTFFAQHWAQDPLFMSIWPNQPYVVQTTSSVIPGATYPECQWDNETFLGLLSDAKADTNEATRTDKLAEMQKLFHDEGAYIIWGFQEQIDAMAPNVKGNVQDRSGFPFGYFDFTQMTVNG